MKKLDEYRADRNVVPVADNPEALTSGLDKIMDKILGMVTKSNDEDKIASFKKWNDFFSPFAIHPTTHNREKYIQKVRAEHAELKAV